MSLFRSFSLSCALCRVAGHDPAAAARLGCVQWYATLGVFLLILPSLSGVSTYRHAGFDAPDGSDDELLAA